MTGQKRLTQSFFCFTLVLFLLTCQLQAQDNGGYQRPPEVIAKLIDAPSTPSVSIYSKAEWMLLMERPGYPRIEEVSAKELRIAGTRIDPATNGRSRQRHMTGLRMRNVSSGEEFTFSGLPAKAQIGNVSWSNNEKKIGFTNTTANGIELWVANVETRKHNSE